MTPDSPNAPAPKGLTLAEAQAEFEKLKLKCERDAESFSEPSGSTYAAMGGMLAHVLNTLSRISPTPGVDEARVLTELRDVIANLPCNEPMARWSMMSRIEAYELGHRDARKAAAALLEARIAPAPEQIPYSKLSDGDLFRFAGMTNRYQKIDAETFKLFGDGRRIPAKDPSAAVVRIGTNAPVARATVACETCEKLPKTSDGVVIVPGMTVYPKLLNDDELEMDHGGVVTAIKEDGEIELRDSQGEKGPSFIDIDASEVFSTRESAIAKLASGDE